MNEHGATWCVSVPRSAAPIACPRCGIATSTEIPFIDHQLHPCRRCSVTTFMWSTSDTDVQIAVDAAPAPLKAFLTWASKELDEREFTELVADGLGRFVDPTPASANPMLHPLLAKALADPSSSAVVLDRLQTMQAELRLGATDWENPDLLRFLEAMEAWLGSVAKKG